MDKSVNRWGMELASALSKREACRLAGNSNGYRYYRNRVQYCRSRLNVALRDAGFEVPVPEQRPLIVDDLVPWFTKHPM